MKKIRISQTMIVKNEENNIKNALSWGKEIFFEQIVVDTGSSDNTVQIAKDLGANVMYFQWIDDFSAAKNFAIEQCKGDWIAFLDADEYFLPEDVNKIIPILNKAEQEDAKAIRTSYTSIDEKGRLIFKSTSVRIFKNIDKLRYKRRIHESLKYPGYLKEYDATDELNIITTGYEEEVAKKKQASGRNRKLLLIEVKENPFDPEILGYLGDEYTLNENDRKKAIALYKSAIKNLPENVDDHDTRTADTFIKLIVLLGLNDKEEEIIDIYRTATAKMQKNADFSYHTGVYFYNKKKYKEAYPYFREAFDKLEKYTVEGNSEYIICNLANAYAQYGKILLELKDLKGAVAIESSVLKENKKEYTALSTILQAFSESSVEANEVLKFLRKIYDFDKSFDKLLILRAARETEYKSIYSLVYEMLDKKELMLLEGM
ncbi:hypothetical protein BXO88_08740 [Oribacterium sp. C9]|uniref:tetratricopeptide repeat-containing glycosyltransferase family 2 protein n=1 Tax=Oribacterium sp. C9 TaxID=1943579 RepID=UPI000990314E|nr:glycosyltransferase family 2 protein [Oribacterium sp. C9]OON86128.1 hypothetical protein BXO88_08740 [Oribacterium sp. C9]